MSDAAYTPDEMMVVAAARLLDKDDVVFIGIGLPSKAATLASRTHASELSMIYESGTLDTSPSVLPLSIGDPELSKTAKTVVSVPEMFNYWLQGGRIKTGFLGAAQIDRYGNLNTTVIGDYDSPKVRLPGAGGAPEIASFCKRTLIMLRQSPRSFVEKVDFLTTVGHLEGGKSRDGLRVSGSGPQAVITDLGILEPHPESREFVLTTVHPGVNPEAVVNATGWPLQVADEVRTTKPPSEEELTILRSLKPSETSNVGEMVTAAIGATG
jgi:glutaconate CoA-transferase subunit B